MRLWTERTEVDAVFVAAAPRLGLRGLAYYSATTGYLIHNTYA